MKDDDIKTGRIIKRTRLKEIAKLFLKLGIIGFGGPAVHIAMMQQEVVKKRKWITDEQFLDLMGATNLIPGPNSTEMTMHCGHERAGWKGLVVAGLCFIIPAVIITSGIAWAYFEYGQLPHVQPFIYGIKPAIISVIVVAMIPLGKKALKSIELGITGTAAAIAVLYGLNEILVLFTAGLTGIILYLIKQKHNTVNGVFGIIILQIINAPVAISQFKTFWVFLKIGSILYGSGYVLFAFLDAELVSKGIISRQLLIDAIAVGQFTPGPVFSAATFIGWQIGGIMGAFAATIGIFLPSFLFVALLNPWIPKLRSSKIMSVFLDTINIASVAVILSVVTEMGRETLRDWRMILIAVISLFLSFYFKKINSAFIVLGGGLVGFLLSLL